MHQHVHFVDILGGAQKLIEHFLVAGDGRMYIGACDAQERVVYGGLDELLAHAVLSHFDILVGMYSNILMA